MTDQRQTPTTPRAANAAESIRIEFGVTTAEGATLAAMMDLAAARAARQRPGTALKLRARAARLRGLVATATA